MSAEHWAVRRGRYASHPPPLLVKDHHLPFAHGDVSALRRWGRVVCRTTGVCHEGGSNYDGPTGGGNSAVRLWHVTDQLCQLSKLEIRLVTTRTYVFP
jgi:hypothetical protein